MRTGTNDILDEEPDDRAFRQQLAALNEPAPLEPPSDLVIRTARRLPNQAPHTLIRQERIRALVRIILAILIFAVATFGAWALLIEAPAPLTIQLILKPLLGAIGAIGIPLLLIGLGAAIGSGLLLNRHGRTITTMRVSA